MRRRVGRRCGSFDLVNGIHDLGGMHGFGKVEPEPDEPVFHEDWEGRVFGLFMASMGLGLFQGPGGMRYALESLDPSDYLDQSYFERWHQVLEAELLECGILDRDELGERVAELRADPESPLASRGDPEARAHALEMIYGLRSPECQATCPPRFAPGDRVRTRNLHPSGHTRMPRYVRDKIGTVERVWGFHLFQDALPEDVEPAAEPLYNIRFEGRELWGDAAEPGQCLYIDLWESHLEAPDHG
jgi:nitrile hydratase